MTDEGATSKRPLVPWVVVSVIAVLLTVGVVVAIVTQLGRTPADDAASPSPTSASASPTAAAEPTDDPAASDPPAESTPPVEEALGAIVPDECASIYTRDLTPDFDGLVLNPPWTLQDGAVQTGSRDERAVVVLESADPLICHWGSPGGGSGRGLVTNVVEVPSSQWEEVRDGFVAAGANCYSELGGTRCVSQTEPSPDGQSGESHFYRDGIWIATLWVNAGPDGYTHDIVAALFG